MAYLWGKFWASVREQQKESELYEELKFYPDKVLNQHGPTAFSLPGLSGSLRFPRFLGIRQGSCDLPLAMANAHDYKWSTCGLALEMSSFWVLPLHFHLTQNGGGHVFRMEGFEILDSYCPANGWLSVSKQKPELYQAMQTLGLSGIVASKNCFV